MGLDDQGSVEISNDIRMTGSADGVGFSEVTSNAKGSFKNQGLVKSATVDDDAELIEYEVLINPYKVTLPQSLTISDSLDQRLQFDRSSLRLYKATVKGTMSESADETPQYEITDSEAYTTLNISTYDPSTNTFTVDLPIDSGSSGETVALDGTGSGAQVEQDSSAGDPYINEGDIPKTGDSTPLIAWIGALFILLFVDVCVILKKKRGWDT